MMTVRKIIEAAGGYSSIVAECERRGISIDPSTPRKWVRNGIPAKYWSLVMKLSGASAVELMSANGMVEEDAA